MLLSRSSAESHLYMDLHPCSCGARDFDQEHSLVSRGADLVALYEGPCRECGARRSFEFVLSEEKPPVYGDSIVFGGQTPSAIIDPGEYLAVSDTHAKRAPMSTDGLDPARRAAGMHAMNMAVSALIEVLKFIPRGGDAVPRAAFTSEAGRAVYRAEPGRFRKDRLHAVLRAYRDIARGYS